MRAKTWFRLSKCYANLGWLDRAKEAMAKGLETCDDQQLLLELSQHSLRIDALERQQNEKQKKQFAGFFDKLQGQGGYVETKKPDRGEQWGRLDSKEKLTHIEQLDDSDSENDDEASVDNASRHGQQTQAFVNTQLPESNAANTAESERHERVSQLQHEQEKHNRDVLEDEELEKARQRLAQQRIEKADKLAAATRAKAAHWNGHEQ